MTTTTTALGEPWGAWVIENACYRSTYY